GQCQDPGVPVGTAELSPVPIGPHRAIFIRPYRDCLHMGRSGIPAMNRWATFNRPYRDEYLAQRLSFRDNEPHATSEGHVNGSPMTRVYFSYARLFVASWMFMGGVALLFVPTASAEARDARWRERQLQTIPIEQRAQWIEDRDNVDANSQASLRLCG